MIEQEMEVIEEVYFAIKRDGPISTEELVARGLESEEHIERITRGLERAGKVLWTTDGWVDY